MKRSKTLFLLILLAIAAIVAAAAYLLLGNGGDVAPDGAGTIGDARCAPVADMTPSFIDESGDRETLGYVDARKLVRGGNGKLYAAYRKKAGGSDEFQIFVSTSDDNGATWRLANGGRAVSEGTGYDQRVPSILLRGSTLHIVWYGADRDSAEDSNRHEVKYSSSSDSGGTFSPWRNIGVVEGYGGQDQWQEHPVLSAGPDDGDPIFIVWEGKDSEHENQQIKFSRSGDGGAGWSEPVNVQPTPGRSQSRPTLLVDGDRLYIFAYGSQAGGNGTGDNSGNSAGNGIIMTRSENAGGTWEEWTTLSANGDDNRHVTALLDSQKNLHIAYRRHDGDNSRVVYGFSSNGSDWEWSDAPAGSGRNQFFPSLSEVGDPGLIYLAWSEQPGAGQAPREELSDEATGVLARVTIEQEVNPELTLGGFWITMPRRSSSLEFLFVSDGGTSSLCYSGRNINRPAPAESLAPAPAAAAAD